MSGASWIESRNSGPKAGRQGVGEKAQAEGLLGVALGNLLAVAENYPDLKASQKFPGITKIFG